MNCRYCHRECNNIICISCDAKHCAKHIFERVQRERTFYKDPQYFNELQTKERLKQRDILGMEGLAADEANHFWTVFEVEYSRLKGAQV